MAMRLFVLDDAGAPLEVDDLEVWASWFEDPAHRLVQQDGDDTVMVSTVFLGLDHNYHEHGPPLLWETMVFGGPEHGECSRYASRADALAGHHATWQRVKAALP